MHKKPSNIAQEPANLHTRTIWGDYRLDRREDLIEPDREKTLDSEGVDLLRLDASDNRVQLIK